MNLPTSPEAATRPSQATPPTDDEQEVRIASGSERLHPTLQHRSRNNDNNSALATEERKIIIKTYKSVFVAPVLTDVSLFQLRPLQQSLHQLAVRRLCAA